MRRTQPGQGARGHQTCLPGWGPWASGGKRATGGVRALEPLSTFRTCAQPLSTSGGSCAAASAAGAGAAAGAAACGCACAASAPACGWSARAHPQPVAGRSTRAGAAGVPVAGRPKHGRGLRAERRHLRCLARTRTKHASSLAACPSPGVAVGLGRRLICPEPLTNMQKRARRGRERRASGQAVQRAVQRPAPEVGAVAAAQEAILRVGRLLGADQLDEAGPVARGKLRQLGDALRERGVGRRRGEARRRLPRLEEARRVAHARQQRPASPWRREALGAAPNRTSASKVRRVERAESYNHY